MEKIRKIIEQARQEKRDFLLEYEAEKILSLRGIEVAPAILAETLPEALRAAGRIGFPVVMKVMSPRIIHKSDAGVVEVNVEDEKKLRRTWKKILSSAREYDPEAEIRGVLVQKMLAGGREVIVGGSRDPQFGPVIMFGLGGVFVEVLKDVVFRVAPVSKAEALRMIREIRSYSILKGVRGEKAIDFPALASLVSKISRLMSDYDEISELDANPVRVDEDGACVLDARIMIS